MIVRALLVISWIGWASAAIAIAFLSFNDRPLGWGYGAIAVTACIYAMADQFTVFIPWRRRQK